MDTTTAIDWHLQHCPCFFDLASLRVIRAQQQLRALSGEKSLPIRLLHHTFDTLRVVRASINVGKAHLECVRKVSSLSIVFFPLTLNCVYSLSQ